MNKALLALFFLCCHVVAAENDDFKRTSPKKDIDKVITTVKLGSITLKDKLDYYGIYPTFASVHKMTKEDVIEDPRMTVGDIEYSIDFDPAKLIDMCNMLGTADFLYHKHKFKPETKTAIWLMTGKCETPE